MVIQYLLLYVIFVHFLKGLPEVCSSYHATKVSFNENCPEVKHFIER